MSEENNEENKIEQLMGNVMQMVQYYLNHINYEMLRMLHEGGLCAQYTQMCMICKQEEQLVAQEALVESEEE